MQSDRPHVPPSLYRTQCWVQEVITHPDGVEAGVLAARAGGLAAPGTGASAHITRSQSLSAEERLAIYHNAYFARLLSCLREEFPVLLTALSEEVFEAFAFGYLQSYPSRSYTLGRLADGFARYLTETLAEERGDASAPAGWEEFIIDLATLEWTYGEVFDGAGIENRATESFRRLAALPPERLLELRLVPAPCLRLLALRFPAHRYYAAARGGELHVLPGAEPTFLVVSRQNYVVVHLELSADEFGLLKQLIAGQTLGEALSTRASSGTDGLEQRLGAWFARWSAERFFVESASGT